MKRKPSWNQAYLIPKFYTSNLKKRFQEKKPDINGLGGTVDESIYSGKVQAEFTQLTWADVKKSTFQKVIEIDCPQNKK